MDENYTYIVRCADGTLYTGWTNDLKKRIKAHNSGKGAKYTKTRRPVELVYSDCAEYDKYIYDLKDSEIYKHLTDCLLYTSPSPRDRG